MPFFKKKKEPAKIDTSPLAGPNNSRLFRHGDQSDNLANNHFQQLEFYHLPSGYFVTFKAFLDSFADNYKSDWKPEKLYGRMDPVATFERTTRQISVGFKIPANSIQEAEHNMRRMSLLAQMLYPSFERGGESGEAQKKCMYTIKGSPLFKVKFLNWIRAPDGGGGSAESSGLLGYVDGFAFTPDLDMGVFTAGLDLYPKSMALTFNLNVIHEAQLGWDIEKASNSAADKSRAGFRSGPISPQFPYGKNIQEDQAIATQKRTAKRAKRMKKLAQVSKDLIGGA